MLHADGSWFADLLPEANAIWDVGDVRGLEQRGFDS